MRCSRMFLLRIEKVFVSVVLVCATLLACVDCYGVRTKEGIRERFVAYYSEYNLRKNDVAGRLFGPHCRCV